jgi:hypothetical protein
MRIISRPRLSLSLILEEQFFELLCGVLRAINSMTDGPRVGEDLIVIASFVGFVTEEVDLLEALIFDMAKSICLVPAGWEDIE